MVTQPFDGTIKSARGGEAMAAIADNGKLLPTDDVTGGTVKVNALRLYELVENDAIKQGTVTIKAAAPSLRLYAFTFRN